MHINKYIEGKYLNLKQNVNFYLGVNVDLDIKKLLKINNLFFSFLNPPPFSLFAAGLFWFEILEIMTARNFKNILVIF